MSNIDLDAIRTRIARINPDVPVTSVVDMDRIEDAVRMLATVDAPALLALVDEAQAHIEAAREHLQTVIATPRYVDTHVQAHAQRALHLLDGEPDGADL